MDGHKLEEATLPSSGETALQNPDVSLRDQVRGDLEAWLRIWQPGWEHGQQVPRSTVLALIWRYLGLRATLLYRLSHYLWRLHVPFLPAFLSHLNISLHGFDVPASVVIGPGLYVPHPVGTVIMAERIGANVSLISNITIGMRHEATFPTIGDNVFIGAGARILGRISIGAHAQIGANAVVLVDVPPYSTAVGVPARVTVREASQDSTMSASDLSIINRNR